MIFETLFESDQKSKKLKMLCNIRVSPASSGTSKMNSIPNIMRRGSLKPSPRISSLLSKRRTSTPSLKTVPEINKKSPRVTFEDKNKKKIKSKPKAKTTIPVGMIERRHSTVLGLDDTKALNERRLKQLMDEHVTGITVTFNPSTFNLHQLKWTNLKKLKMIIFGFYLDGHTITTMIVKCIK